MFDDAQDAFYSALLDDDVEQLYERAPCGYLSTTADGTIIKVNQTFLHLTGYERGELVGRRTFAELLTAGGRLYHETHYAPMLRMQGRTREIALEVVRADGVRLPVLVNSVLETDDAGTPLVIRTAVFDATERRQYERELMRARRRAEESETRASALARTLQATLIPPARPVVPGLDVAAVYRPAGSGDEVGGDFYDVFPLGAGEFGLFIGDVCGKGAGAAAVTSLARYTLRAVSVLESSPAAVLRTVNDVLLADPGARLSTVALARLRSTAGRWSLVLACAGHPLPLRAAPGVAAHRVGVPGLVLGVLPDVPVSDSTVDLRPGDVVVLFTDGVTEGRASDGEFYDDDRLFAALDRVMADPAAATAAGVADTVLHDVLAFQDGVPRDDIAVLVLRVPPVQT